MGVGIGWYVQSDLTSGLYRSDALSALGDDAGSSPGGDINILLIGLDSRKAMDGSDLPAEFVTDKLHAGDSDVGGYNTNTLILLHVPGDGGKARHLPGTITPRYPPMEWPRPRKPTEWRRLMRTPNS